jgi:hypothetical protein
MPGVRLVAVRPDNARMVHRRRRGRAVSGLTGLAVVLALAAASCGASEFQYVRSSDAGTGFKVPSGWAVFDKDSFLGKTGAGASTPDPIQWLVALDGDPTPSVGHVYNPTDLARSHPDGFAMIFTLSAADRDRMSLGGIRNFLFPVDGLMNLGTDDATMLSYDDSLSSEDGLRGVRMVFEFRPAALAEVSQDPTGSSTGGTDAGVAFSSDFVVLDQVAYLDSHTDKVYLMALMCSADCYDRYKQEISNSIGSWTVKP